MKKENQVIKESYTAPIVELVEFEVEIGFAQSIQNGVSGRIRNVEQSTNY